MTEERFNTASALPQWACTWPDGACECQRAQEQTPEDHAGRVWMHCESGLNMSKASMDRFMMFCLRNSVEIGTIYAFNPKYERCQVLASVRLRPDQFADFEKETGGILRKPPRIILSGGVK